MANKTMKTLTWGGTTYEIYDDAARQEIEELNNTKFDADDLDETLTVSGKIADAKITGEKIKEAKQTADNAITKADNAQNRADEAYNLANNANTKADNAQNKADEAYNLANNAQKKEDAIIMQYQTISLSVDGWIDNIQSVNNVEGVTADNVVLVSPSSDSYEMYGENVIFCISQDLNTLTFKCNNVPTSEIIVNVVVFTQKKTQDEEVTEEETEGEPENDN